MIDEALKELNAAAAKSHESLAKELGRLRTGRANPNLLDTIRVDFYGSKTPISQMANVTVPEARMLMVKPWDKTSIKAIEKAILESNLGLNPQNDGELIRLPLPALTEERRKDLVKVAKKAGEDSKIAIRQARRDANDILDALKKDGDISEDECERSKKKVDEVVQAAQGRTDEIVSKKEADILEI